MDHLKLIRKIEEGEIKPLYVLHGEENYFIDEVANAIIANAVSEAEQAFNLTTFYGKDAIPQQIIDAARRFPMMAERQVVVLKEAQTMHSASFKTLEDYFLNLVPTTVFIIAHKNKKIDGRSTFLKSAKKAGEVFYAKAVKEEDALGWLKSLIVQGGFSIETKALAMMGELIGSNLSKAKIEFEKLLPHLKAGDKITPDLVQKYVGVHKEYNIFELQNALSVKNKTKAFNIANHYASNKSIAIQPVLAILLRFFKHVLIVAQNRGIPQNDLLQKLRMRNSWGLRDYQTGAKNYTEKKLYEIFRLIAQYDLESKGVGVSGKSEWNIYRELIFKILN